MQYDFYKKVEDAFLKAERLARLEAEQRCVEAPTTHNSRVGFSSNFQVQVLQHV